MKATSLLLAAALFAGISPLRPSLAFTTAGMDAKSDGRGTPVSASASASVSAPSDNFRLGYVTDVEGHLDYFKSIVARSNVLDQVGPDDDDTKLELSLRPGCYFVYGGDAVDKWPGDIRLCRALVSLKRRNPDRVFLLVGNRDLNKLRFSAELSDADLRRDVDDIPPPHWDPKAPTLRAYLESVAARRGAAGLEEVNTRPERLRYMLLHTLGCPDTFEFRREELAVLQGCDIGSITDEDVVDSFLREVESPDGSLRQYLEHADVAAVVGNTLFVHGAVDRRTMRFVPRRDSRFERPERRPPPGRVCDDVREWVAELNGYLRDGLRDYAERPMWDAERTTRGGESLLALQNRAAMWGRSIISNCYGDGGCITSDSALAFRDDPDRPSLEQTDPLVFEDVSSDPMDPEVASWLLKNGIRRVVVGHKPTGDCPAVLSAAYTGVEIASADTSYSDVSADDNRGLALPVVEIVGGSALDNRLEISGRFRDGVDYHCVLNRLHGGGIDKSVGDRNLGQRTRDGYWIKAATAQQYRLCRGKGRMVEYKSVSVSEVFANGAELGCFGGDQT